MVAKVRLASGPAGLTSFNAFPEKRRSFGPPSLPVAVYPHALNRPTLRPVHARARGRRRPLQLEGNKGRARDPGQRLSLSPLAARSDVAVAGPDALADLDLVGTLFAIQLWLSALSRRALETAIPRMGANASQGRPLPIYGRGFTRQKQVNVADHCNGTERYLRHREPSGTYNLPTEQKMPKTVVFDAICEQIDAMFAHQPAFAVLFLPALAARGQSTRILKTFITTRLDHDWRYAIDGCRVLDLPGYRPCTDFNSGLAHTLAWQLTTTAPI
jgi:hypothetical protein